MFKSGKEEIRLVPPQPSQEELERGISAAQARIETVKGVDYLDGYRLPPDNDEPFDPSVRSAHFTRVHWGSNDGKEHLTRITTETQEFVSTISNRLIRDSHIRSIGMGGKPLFLGWDEVTIPRMPERTTLTKRFKRVAHTLLGQLAA